MPLRIELLQIVLLGLANLDDLLHESALIVASIFFIITGFRPFRTALFHALDKILDVDGSRIHACRLHLLFRLRLGSRFLCWRRNRVLLSHLGRLFIRFSVLNLGNELARLSSVHHYRRHPSRQVGVRALYLLRKLHVYRHIGHLETVDELDVSSLVVSLLCRLDFTKELLRRHHLAAAT